MRVIERPQTLSDDWYALMDWEFRGPLLDYDYVFHVHCTAPFLSSVTVETAVRALVKDNKKHSIFTCYKETLYTWRDGKPGYDTRVLPRSQDIESTLVESHGLYGIDRRRFLEVGHRYPAPIIKLVTKLEGFDINDQTDLDIARAIAGHPSSDSIRRTDI